MTEEQDEQRQEEAARKVEFKLEAQAFLKKMAESTYPGSLREDIKLIRLGDIAAQARFLKHFEKVVKTAARTVQFRDPDEIAQIALIHVYHVVQHEDLSKVEKLEAYLTKTVYNRIYRHLSRTSRSDLPLLSAIPIQPSDKMVSGEFDPIEELIPDDTISPAQQAEHRELIASLDKALPEREKTVVIEHYGLESGEKKSFEEIGEKFGMTKQRIHALNKRALAILRSKYGLIRRIDAREKLSALKPQENCFELYAIYLLLKQLTGEKGQSTVRLRLLATVTRQLKSNAHVWKAYAPHANAKLHSCKALGVSLSECYVAQGLIRTNVTMTPIGIQKLLEIQINAKLKKLPNPILANLICTDLRNPAQKQQIDDEANGSGT